MGISSSLSGKRIVGVMGTVCCGVELRSRSRSNWATTGVRFRVDGVYTVPERTILSGVRGGVTILMLGLMVSGSSLRINWFKKPV